MQPANSASKRVTAVPVDMLLQCQRTCYFNDCERATAVPVNVLLQVFNTLLLQVFNTRASVRRGLHMCSC